MEALFALSTYDLAGTAPASHAGPGLGPTLYSIGIIVCLALLLLWWGVVRPRG
jgi:hypothetical protein